MPIARLTREVNRLAKIAPRREMNPVLVRLAKDPAAALALAGLPPDPWQQDLLRSRSRRMLLCCTRQGGKSTISAALSLHTALLRAGALILLLSPSLRQSGELFKRIADLYRRLGRPVLTT